MWLNGWYDNILGGYMLAAPSIDISMAGGESNIQGFHALINLTRLTINLVA